MIAKVIRILTQYVYTRAEVILLEHQVRIAPQSPATIVHATEANLPDTLHFQTEAQLRQFQLFLQHGDKGYLGYVDGKCIHRSWVQSGPQKVRLHKFYPMQLQAGEAFIHYCETDPAVRGQHIFAHVLGVIASEMEGNRILIAVDEGNRSSQRSMEKAGFREIARCRVVVIFGFTKRTWTHNN